MGSFSKNVALLALGFWLGCVILFGAVVAPTIFSPDFTPGAEPEHTGVLSGLSHDVAGAIIGTILRRIYLITYGAIGVAVFFLLMASFGEAKGAKGPRRALVLCLFVLAFNALNDYWITHKMSKIRLQMVNNSKETKQMLKKDFDSWHKVSTRVYGTAVVFGLMATGLLLPSMAAGKSKTKK